jgi:hypothetical protein
MPDGESASKQVTEWAFWAIPSRIASSVEPGNRNHFWHSVSDATLKSSYLSLPVCVDG